MTNSSSSCSSNTPQCNIPTDRAAAAAAAALCTSMHCFSIDCGEDTRSSCGIIILQIFSTPWNKNNKVKIAHNKTTAIRDSNHGRQGISDSDLPATLLHDHSYFFAVHPNRDWYVSTHLHVRIDAWELLTKKRKQHPPPGDDTSTGRWREHGQGRPRQSRERRARWGTSSKHRTRRMPNGGLHLELGRWPFSNLP